MASVLFFSEGVNFVLPHPRKTASWIRLVVSREKHTLRWLNCVFCSDAHLFNLNTSYLHHQTLTDILTFDYSSDTRKIEGEVYVSIERVRENASKFNVSFDDELHRVIVHGVLHLLGYDDNQAAERAKIRKKEEAYLSLRS